MATMSASHEIGGTTGGALLSEENWKPCARRPSAAWSGWSSSHENARVRFWKVKSPKLRSLVSQSMKSLIQESSGMIQRIGVGDGPAVARTELPQDQDGDDSRDPDESPGRAMRPALLQVDCRDAHAATQRLASTSRTALRVDFADDVPLLVRHCQRLTRLQHPAMRSCPPPRCPRPGLPVRRRRPAS